MDLGVVVDVIEMTRVLEDVLVVSNEWVVVPEVRLSALEQHRGADVDVRDVEVVALLRACMLPIRIVGRSKPLVSAVTMHAPHIFDTLIDVGRGCLRCHEGWEDSNSDHIDKLKLEES